MRVDGGVPVVAAIESGVGGARSSELVRVLRSQQPNSLQSQILNERLFVLHGGQISLGLKSFATLTGVGHQDLALILRWHAALLRETPINAPLHPGQH